MVAGAGPATQTIGVYMIKILVAVFSFLLPVYAMPWAAGAYTNQGNYITHALIVENAVSLLYNSDISDRQKEYIKNTYIGNITYLKVSAEMPDIDETFGGTNAGHFFNFRTGTNWLGLKKPTSKTEFLKHVESAKGYDIDHIGRAIHYLEDVCEPHHALNQIPPIYHHVDFEDYVNNLQLMNPDVFRAYSYSDLSMFEYYSFISLCSIKAAAYDANFASIDYNNWYLVANEMVPFTESMVASFLHKIMIDNGY